MGVRAIDVPIFVWHRIDSDMATTAMLYRFAPFPLIDYRFSDDFLCVILKEKTHSSFPMHPKGLSMMKKYNVSISEEIERKIEADRKKRGYETVPETIRAILSDWYQSKD